MLIPFRSCQAFYSLKSDCLAGGDPLDFASLKGKVVLVTNVASR